VPGSVLDSLLAVAVMDNPEWQVDNPAEPVVLDNPPVVLGSLAAVVQDNPVAEAEVDTLGNLVVLAAGKVMEGTVVERRILVLRVECRIPMLLEGTELLLVLGTQVDRLDLVLERDKVEPTAHTNKQTNSPLLS
jgi:hypothetical protein